MNNRRDNIMMSKIRRPKNTMNGGGRGVAQPNGMGRNKNTDGCLIDKDGGYGKGKGKGRGLNRQG